MNHTRKLTFLSLGNKDINSCIGRRKFAKLVSVGTIGFISTVAIKPALSEYQNAWRYCKKCHAMFYNGFREKGRCVAGGSHEASGFNFVLSHDIPDTQTTQKDWRYCKKCHLMFYDGFPEKGRCVAGGSHEASGFNFVLSHDIPDTQTTQKDWRYCKKCHVMFYDGFSEKGQCAVGGGHEASGFNFVLLHDVAPPPQTWKIHQDVTFREGVAIGGSFDLALTQQGDISFSGHFHNSGADNYRTTIVVVLMSPEGQAYSVTHEGHTYGTFHSGSRNDDWVKNEKNDLIARYWDTQFSRATWRWAARAESKTLESLQSIVDDLVNQLAQEAGKAAIGAAISLL